MIDHIRLTAETRDRLNMLKRRTGIRQWNVLCRWAFCLSLAEEKPPPMHDLRADSNLEMTWQTFAGRHAGILTALLKARCLRDGLDISDDTLAITVRAHVRRGVSYLTTKKIQSIEELLALPFETDSEMSARRYADDSTDKSLPELGKSFRQR